MPRTVSGLLSILVLGSALFLDVLPAALGISARIRILDILVAGWLLYALATGIRHPLAPAARRVAMLLLCFAAVTILLTLVGALNRGPVLSTLDGMAPGIRTVLYGSVFFLAYDAVVRGEVDPRFVGWIVGVGFLVHFGYAILQFLAGTTGWIPGSSLVWQPVRVTSGGVVLTSQFGAATGFTNAVFVLSNLGGLLAAVSAGILIMSGSVVDADGEPRERWMGGASWLGLCVGIGMILLSFRRTALVAALASISLLLVARSARGGVSLSRVLKGAGILAAGGTVFAALGAAAVQFSDLLRDRLTALAILAGGGSGMSQVPSLEFRADVLWSNYLQLFHEHPFGIGLYPPNVLGIASDNVYLTYGVQGGVVYLALYLVLLLALAYLGWRLTHSQRRAAVAGGGVVLGWVGYTTVASLATNLTMASHLWVLAWWGIGAAVALHEVSFRRVGSS